MRWSLVPFGGETQCTEKGISKVLLLLHSLEKSIPLFLFKLVEWRTRNFYPFSIAPIFHVQPRVGGQVIVLKLGSYF